MRRPILGMVLGLCALLLTGCPSSPPPALETPVATSNADPVVAPPVVRTAAQCQQLLELKNHAVGALENEDISNALKALEELRGLAPNDPLVTRNIAVAKFSGLKKGIVDSAQLQETVEQLLAKDSTPSSKWLAGRSLIAISEQQPDAAQREAGLHNGTRLLEQVMRAEPANAAIAFELFEATRYATTSDLQAVSQAALAAAASRAPDNLFILTESLLQQAEAQSRDFTKTVDSIAKVAGPLRDGILRRTRVNMDDLIAAARDAASNKDWRTALTKSRQLSAIIRPEDRTQSDRRQLTPHQLEFLIHDFPPDVCPNASMKSAGPLPQWTLAETGFDTADLGPLRDALPVDFDLDGRTDLIVLGEQGLRILAPGQAGNGFTKTLDVTAIGDLNGIIAADFDRDSLNSGTPPTAGVCYDADPDVVLFGPDGVTVLRNQLADGIRQLVAVEQTGGLDLVRDVRTAIPGDFDHDGDLDLALATATGLQIWSQTGAMDFVNTTDRTQLPEGDWSATALVAVDWDRDVDLDIVATGSPVGGYFENLRHGEFRWRSFDKSFESDRVAQAAVIEADGNVSWDLVTVDDQGVSLTLTTTPDRGVNRYLKHINVAPTPLTSLISGDWNNDGWIDLAGRTADGIQSCLGQPGGGFSTMNQIEIGNLSPHQLRAADVDQDGDLDWLVVAEAGISMLKNDTQAAGGWLAVRVRGDEEANSGRVNQYGLGSLVEVRARDRYQARVVTDQATHFGLGDIDAPDSLRVLWTNGVPQVVLQPQRNQAVCERQALKGSCPYLYTWDGERFVFFTDLLWAAPLGLQFAEGVIAPNRPWEYLLVPGKALAEREGRYDLRVTEELWEAGYFDQIELLAIDHPADIEVFTNEKVGPAEIAGFQVHTVRERHLPIAARDQRGRDVFDQIAAADGVYLKAFDQQYRQGLTELHALELDLGPLKDPKNVTLFLTGWIYPTDTSLNVALSQDPTLDGPKPPSLSVPNAQGEWQIVRPFMGFPGGKTKTIAVDLSDVFLTSDYRVRIETTHEIYWDAAFFTVDEPPSETRVTPLRLMSADLRYRGFSAVIPPGPNAPETYDYDDVSMLPKWPPMDGGFTRYGDVLELLTTTDDRLVVMSSGDEIAMSFEIPSDPLPAGWKRDFFLHNVGWDKDADLHTVYGQSSEPLPFQSMSSYPVPPEQPAPDTSRYRDYLQRYQTRRESPSHFWNLSPGR